MTIALRQQESYRDDFTFANSPEAIRRFPFPFDQDRYMYAVNVEPHVRGGPTAAYDHLLDVVEHYLNNARVELAAFNSAVTDWERVRGFERL